MNQDIAVFMVPFAIAIGGVLIAAGGLYFINIRFVNSAPVAIASLIAGVIVYAFLEIILAGSANAFFKAQQVQTSTCELEGEAAHPEARLGKDQPIIHAAIVACMTKAGYEWSSQHRHCKEANVATNPFCYIPTSAFDRAVTGFLMKFE